MINEQTHNVLDDVFGASEEQVETFFDVLRHSVGDARDPARGNLSEIIEGKETPVTATARYVRQQSGAVQIEHGWHEDNYIWHIRPVQGREWKTSAMRIIYAVSKVFAQHIPMRVTIKIFPPQKMWEINEITYKALDLRNEWGVSLKDIESLNIMLFEVLNTLI